jgi:hypothetical protein
MVNRARRVTRSFGRRRWLLAGILAVALLGCSIFAVRTVVYTVYWRQQREAPIERWMPVRYIAHSYDVPAEVLWAALGQSEVRSGPRGDLRPLSEVAEAGGRTFEEARGLLEQAIAEHRASTRPPPRGDRAGP